MRRLGDRDEADVGGCLQSAALFVREPDLVVVAESDHGLDARLAQARHERSVSVEVLEVVAHKGAAESRIVVGEVRREHVRTLRRELRLHRAWHHLQHRASGTEVIAPTKDRQRTKPRRYAPPQGREAERIETLLSKAEAKALYRRRQQLVERFSPTPSSTAAPTASCG